MRAAMIETLDGPDSISVKSIGTPTPGPGQVVVDVAAVALNFMDTLICRGKYQVKPDLPFSPGAEMAGTVSQVGEGVDGFSEGDRVSAYIGYGGARERVAVDAARLVRVPDSVPLEIASGMNVAYGTALYALRTRLSLGSGQTVAVLGASGGAGLAAVEVARQLGAEVIAVASSDAKLKVCAEHGASHLINYTEGELKNRLRSVTGGSGPGVVYDCVGGPHLDPALRALKPGGRYVVIGFAAGEIPAIPANLVLLKDCDVVGIHWGAWVDEDPAPHAGNIAVLFDWIARGKLVPAAPEVRPLAEAGPAIADLAARRAIGKIVLTP